MDLLFPPKFFREKPGLLSVKYHRWRAGVDQTASNDSITHHKHNTPYVIVAPVPRSPQEEEEEIRQQLQEFAKAADQRVGNQSTAIVPKHKKNRLSHQKTKEAETKQKQLNFIREFEHKLKEEEKQKAAKHKIIRKHTRSRLSYEKTKESELAAFKNQQEQDRIKQKQLKFIRGCEHKSKEEEKQKAAKHKIIPKHTKYRRSYQKTKKPELASFKNQQEQDRIKQKQINFIREFEHKLKEEEERKAAEARKHEERIWQQQVKFIKEFKEKEERERARREKIEAKRALKQRKTKARVMRAKKNRREEEMAMKNRREEEMAKKNRREEEMAKKKRRVKKKAKRRPIRIESEGSFEGESSYGYIYDRARAKELLRKRQAEQKENMADWFYRCCCKVYCCTSVVLMVAVIVIVVI